jgi:hypothetical protein
MVAQWPRAKLHDGLAHLCRSGELAVRENDAVALYAVRAHAGPMNDPVSRSLRNLGVRLNMAIDAVIQAETDLNALRRKAAMEPMPKAFYLPTEHRMAVREVESRARAGTWRQPTPVMAREPSLQDPLTALRTIAAAMTHPLLCAEDWPMIIAIVAGLANREQAPSSEGEAQLIAQFCDGFARRMRAVGPKSRARQLRKHREWFASTQGEDEDKPEDEDNPADHQDEDDQAEEGPPPVKPDDEPEVRFATAAEILRAGDIRRGEITSLPVDPVAREIVRQGALRRGEKDPTL